MPSMQDGYSFAPPSDEELQKITVGERKPHKASITLVEYDPRWLELFEQVAMWVCFALGSKALLVRRDGISRFRNGKMNGSVEIWRLIGRGDKVGNVF